jgi:hypothetical protein
MKPPEGAHAATAVEAARAPVGPAGSRWQLGLSLALLSGWILFLAITASA